MRTIAIFISTLGLLTACRFGASVEEGRQVAVTEQAEPDGAELAGTFTGTFPCADCEGIDVMLYLEAPDYRLSMVYMGKEAEPYISEGSFLRQGDTIRLDGAEPAMSRYLVDESGLTRLGQSSDTAAVSADMACRLVRRAD